jgi:uncharacterized SAM-binding protein YcdF (DUF218 family)
LATSRIVLRVALVFAAAYLVGFAIFIARLPAAPNHAVHADAIVALTGSEDRLDTAVGLLEHGAGQRLLITGVHPFMSKGLLRPLLHGGPRFDCCADLGFVATNTHGNAMETAGWARAHGFHSLIVVTANYHMPRSLEEFSAAMPDVTLVPYPVPEIVAARRWWLEPGAFRTLQYEYVKYLGSVALRTVYPRHWSQPVPATRTATS